MMITVVVCWLVGVGSFEKASIIAHSQSNNENGRLLLHSLHESSPGCFGGRKDKDEQENLLNFNDPLYYQS